MTSQGKINFTKEQLDQLRSAYSKINFVNPEGKAMTKINNFIGSLSDENVQALRLAKIKWISSKAMTEQILRKSSKSLSK